MIQKFRCLSKGRWLNEMKVSKCQQNDGGTFQLLRFSPLGFLQCHRMSRRQDSERFFASVVWAENYFNQFIISLSFQWATASFNHSSSPWKFSVIASSPERRRICFTKQSQITFLQMKISLFSCSSKSKSSTKRCNYSTFSFKATLLLFLLPTLFAVTTAEPARIKPAQGKHHARI